MKSLYLNSINSLKVSSELPQDFLECLEDQLKFYSGELFRAAKMISAKQCLSNRSASNRLNILDFMRFKDQLAFRFDEVLYFQSDLKGDLVCCILCSVYSIIDTSVILAIF